MSIIGVVVVAACGGAATPTQGPAATQTPATATVAPPATSGTIGTAAPTTGAVGNACSLLTAAELKTATGLAYGEGADDGYGQCVYRVGGGTVNNGDGQITVAYVESPLATLKTSFPTGAAFDLQGTAAYWVPDKGVQTMWIDLGTRSLALSFDPITEGILTSVMKVVDVVLPKI